MLISLDRYIRTEIFNNSLGNHDSIQAGTPYLIGCNQPDLSPLKTGIKLLLDKNEVISCFIKFASSLKQG